MQLGRSKTPKGKPQSNPSDDDDSDDEKYSYMKKNLKSRKNPDYGKVVCVDYGDKRGSKNKDV